MCPTLDSQIVHRLTRVVLEHKGSVRGLRGSDNCLCDGLRQRHIDVFSLGLLLAAPQEIALYTRRRH